MLARRRLEEGAVDLHLHVPGEERAQDGGGVGLVEVLDAGALARLFRRGGLDGQQSLDHDFLDGDRAELVEDEPDFVDLRGEEGLDELLRELSSLLERESIEEPDPLYPKGPGSAAKKVARLPTHGDQRHRVGGPPAQEVEGAPDDVRVEGAAEALVRGHHDVERAHRLAPGEERMLVLAKPASQHLNELRHLDGVRPGLHDPLLGAPQLRGGNELHRARDLLRRLDGADPPADVLEGRHRRYAALMPRAATNSAFAA